MFSSLEQSALEHELRAVIAKFLFNLWKKIVDIVNIDFAVLR